MKSEQVDVVSGVPQGSVLGPILFLVYVNDIHEGMTSGVRLFADDCIIYRPIKTPEDPMALQEDLKILETWVQKWLMELNPTKCQTMRITKSKTPSTYPYNILGHVLEAVPSATYLGVTISKDLTWNKHIENIIAKANRTLGTLKRNLKTHRQEIKVRAYNTLVRPKVEYSSTVWDPHTIKNKKQLEMVQHRAACYVCKRYHNTSSVSNMLRVLGWQTLEHRRVTARMTMMYRIVHNLVAIPAYVYLLPAIRQTRIGHSYKYQRIQSTKNYLTYSFFPRSIGQWNGLPPSVVQAASLDQFKGAAMAVDYTAIKY